MVRRWGKFKLESAEECDVAGLEGGPLLWEVIFKEDRFDRADFGADAAIDALGRVDEILFLFVVRVNAIDRTDLDAGCIFRPDAGLGDDVGHGSGLLPPWLGIRCEDCGWARNYAPGARR